jgi:hypothetical protein
MSPTVTPFRARRKRPFAIRLTLLRFCFPTALLPGAPLRELGFHTELGSVFRFSRPLDGLRCPRASRPCFVPLTLLGFSLQRFPLSESRTPLGAVASMRSGSLPRIDVGLADFRPSDLRASAAATTSFSRCGRLARVRRPSPLARRVPVHTLRRPRDGIASGAALTCGTVRRPSGRRVLRSTPKLSSAPKPSSS